MYTKDLTFLLRLLGSSKQSGVLLVEAPGPNESPWQGRFQLNNGMVTSCVLLNKADGRVVLRNEEALAWITSQGKLEWQMEDEAEAPRPPAQPSLTPPRLPPPGGAPAREERYYEEDPLPLPPTVGKSQLAIVPQRTEKGKFVPGNVFASREHRQVLGLVDGQRTVQEIAQLLHRPADFIIYVLQELQAAGFIV
ncbi:MAG TPA: hypothetical protein VJO32_00120 [Ktedonobacteraceae bacterium]|nr:hypothetical protein [Ktedonobacteraceae bacterium]